MKNEIFIKRLLSSMSALGLNQTDLCKKTGIPKSAMSQYIKGSFLPKQDRIFLLANALNVNEAWLMGYDVPKTRSEEQKRNDNLIQIIVRLRNDEDFSNLVSIINSLNDEQYESLKLLLMTFGNK